MTRHAKNSHSSPFFTYHEKSMLPYGTKKQRLGAESFRKFDACMLCNSTVRNPCACSDGHIYCRECILESLLSQKKLIKAHQDNLERRSKEEEEEKAKAREDARERVLRDFERTQSGLGAKVGGSSTTGTPSGNASKVEGEERGQKRKFELDQADIDRMATEAEDAALAKIEKEQLEARKAKLPAFWLPSLAPDAGIEKIKAIKMETMCQASEHPHPLSIKGLIPVKFTPLPTSSSSTAGSSNPTASMCPSCSKELTNSSVSILIKTCGHVCCKACVDKVVRPGKQCVTCDSRAKEKDLVELVRDGTGFAAVGKAEAIKQETAFQ
ncbi:Uncharacterized conserved protein [Phaffia rhodozyma]|uniref:Uncharacterized conserved protein n=1 Tax=Phaffia rhodozyma TaxID=264483 RepID=A0A0F7SQD8_PHARH|nr:Uncharacterized conserved protein [Phaffia rhodozyma]